MVTSTSATEVVDHFAAPGTRASRVLNRWKNRRGLEYVAETVLGHVTRTPYTIAADDIATFRTGHPLGEIRPAQAYRVEDIANWYPAYAFTHLFHQMLEEHETI